MSIKFRRAISSTKDMKSGSVSSLRDTVGDRKIQKFPLPYSFVCTPNQERNFTEEVHAACRRIHEINQEMLRLTKVIVVGDVAVGKTCLVRRFCLHPFDTNYKATIGVDFEAMKCYILNIPYILQVWDTAGQEKFKCIAQSYYRGAKVVLLVFDFTHLNSLYNIPKWLERTLQCAENPLLFLVGTKKDKVAKSAYKLTEQEAVRIANDMGAEYWPVSSKTGCFFMDPPDSLWFLMDPYNHPQDWEGENVEALISRIAVVSFCRDVVKEAETAKEFQVSDDFVKISKSTSPKKKDKKCASCT